MKPRRRHCQARNGGFLRLCSTELRSVDNNTGGAGDGRLMTEERGEEGALKLKVEVRAPVRRAAPERLPLVKKFISFTNIIYCDITKQFLGT
jgi:hypothetical protein